MTYDERACKVGSVEEDARYAVTAPSCMEKGAYPGFHALLWALATPGLLRVPCRSGLVPTGESVTIFDLMLSWFAPDKSSRLVAPTFFNITVEIMEEYLQGLGK